MAVQADRPSSDEASTQTYTVPSSIRAGSYLMVARFHAGAGATGDTVGVATVNVKVTKSGEVRNSNGQPLGVIGFTGGVDSVGLYDVDPFLSGETRELTGVAYSKGEVLVVSPGSFLLDVTSGSDVVRVNEGLSVTALSEGVATLTLTVDGKTSPPLTLRISGPALPTRAINLLTNTLCYDSARGKIWASQPGGTVVDIDPATGSLGAPINVGDQASALGLSDDASTLFVGLNGAHAVRSVDLNSRTAGAQFALTMTGNFTPDARRIAVQPGSNSTIALTTYADYTIYGPQIYDNGIPRTNRLGRGQGSELVWTSTSRIVAVAGNQTFYTAYDVTVDAQGATDARELPNALASPSSSLVRAGGHLYAANGTVLDETSFATVGQFDGLLGYLSFDAHAAGPVVDVAANRAYFVVSNEYDARLIGYRLTDYKPVLNRSLTGVSGLSYWYEANGDMNLLRWGANGLAFRTPEHVYFIDDTSAL